MGPADYGVDIDLVTRPAVILPGMVFEEPTWAFSQRRCGGAELGGEMSGMLGAWGHAMQCHINSASRLGLGIKSQHTKTTVSAKEITIGDTLLDIKTGPPYQHGVDPTRVDC